MNFSVNSINSHDNISTQYETANDAENDWSALDKYLITSADITEESTKQSMISEKKRFRKGCQSSWKKLTLLLKKP